MIEQFSRVSPVPLFRVTPKSKVEPAIIGLSVSVEDTVTPSLVSIISNAFSEVKNSSFLHITCTIEPERVERLKV